MDPVLEGICGGTRVYGGLCGASGRAVSRGVLVSRKVSAQNPQMDYAGLVILLQLEWKYLQMTVPDIDTLMEPIKRDLREAFLPAIFGRGYEVNNRM